MLLCFKHLCCWSLPSRIEYIYKHVVNLSLFLVNYSYVWFNSDRNLTFLEFTADTDLERFFWIGDTDMTDFLLLYIFLLVELSINK